MKRGRRRISSLAGFAWAGIGLAACTALPLAPTDLAEPMPQAIYVVVAEGGTSLVRAVTAARECPNITADGETRRMTLRSPAQVVAPRPAQSAGSPSKAADFPEEVCEAVVAHTFGPVDVAGRPVPSLKSLIREVVVIGDTGCRLKASDGVFQNCNH